MLTTHDAGGLSTRDRAMAEAIDRCVREELSKPRGVGGAPPTGAPTMSMFGSIMSKIFGHASAAPPCRGIARRVDASRP